MPQNFLAGLRANIACKDLEAMWPVGLISVASIYGEAIAILLEQALKTTRSSQPTYSTTFPTSYLVSLAICIIGIIHSGWPRNRVLDFISNYLRYAQDSKVGPILNMGGANVLFSQAEIDAIWDEIESCRRPTINEIRLVNRLSATILAVAEATFFQFHRVVTEKHGPYLCKDRSGCLLIRSVSTLTPPIELWPEFTVPIEFADLERTNIVWWTRSSNYRFDVFSNLVHQFDFNAETLSLALFDRKSRQTSSIHRFSATDLDNLLTVAHTHLLSVLSVIGDLSVAALRERFVGSIFFANRGLLEDIGLDWRKALAMVVQGRQSDKFSDGGKPDAERLTREITLLIGEQQ